MNDLTVCCPHCNAMIRLDKSLAASLIESTRLHYETIINQIQARTSQSVNEQVTRMLELERERLATEEARKARALFAVDINQKAREVAELQDVLKERETRLAQAQRAQADLIRKERELGDARREIDLTIEKRVQEDLAAVRSKATQEAEQTLKLKVLEKEEQLASMRRQIEILKTQSRTRVPTTAGRGTRT